MRLTGRHRDRSRRWTLAGLCLIALLAAPAAWGGPIRVELLALGGYDPVTYFLPEGPQPGSARFEAEWGGRVWRFAIDANRTAFRRDPTVYAPRLGGYDAAGILDRRIVDANPSIFAVLDGRLYLFRDEVRRLRFLDDPALAQSAETIWPQLSRLLDDPDEMPAKPAASKPAASKPAAAKPAATDQGSASMPGAKETAGPGAPEGPPKKAAH